MIRPATFWMMEPLRKYATFQGRARRAEYWWFTLAVIIASILGGIIDGIIGMTFGAFGGPFYFLVALAVLVPSLAVAVRRLHDRDKSGWWYLLVLVPLIGAIVLLVWFCSRGTEGPNRFGEDPLDPAGNLAEVFS